jgi:hypothetical protein
MYVQYLSMAYGRAHADAKRLFPRIRFPCLKKIYGNGIIATVRKAKTLDAHW